MDMNTQAFANQTRPSTAMLNGAADESCGSSGKSDDDRLLATFAGALGIDAGRVTDEFAYNSIPEWDSIGHMAFITEVEVLFGIMLDTNDIIDMSSYGNIRRILQRYGVRLED